MTTQPKRRDLWRLSKAQLIAIILHMDTRIGPANASCAEPGIPAHEAAIRELIDEGGPYFGPSKAPNPTPGACGRWAESAQQEAKL